MHANRRASWFAFVSFPGGKSRVCACGGGGGGRRGGICYSIAEPFLPPADLEVCLFFCLFACCFGLFLIVLVLGLFVHFVCLLLLLFLDGWVFRLSERKKITVH